MTNYTRRATLAMSLAALALPSTVRAAGAQVLKFANIMPVDHPLNVRMGEAAEGIKKDTDGRVEVRLFPASQLGTDNDMLSQLRSGGIDLFAESGLILAALIPVAALSGVGFAFKDYDQVWGAMEGDLGAIMRQAFTKANLVPFARVWDNGFRQTTSSAKPIRAPEDLRGFKIRVPPSRLWTSLFEDLGASPTSIPWGETYSALQTHLADGLENPIAGIYYAKMYEVQKFISMTNHMWDGFWMLGNHRSMEKLSPGDREIVERTINEAALKQRADVRALNDQLVGSLREKGLQFVEVNRDQFRDRLHASTFYTDWKQRVGDEAWSALERYTGALS